MTQKYQGPSQTIYFGNIERGKHHCKFLCLVLLIPVGYIVLQCNPHPRVWSIPVKPVLDKSKLVPGKQALEVYQSLRCVHTKNNYLFTHFHFLPNNLTGSQAVCDLRLIFIFHPQILLARIWHTHEDGIQFLN